MKGSLLDIDVPALLALALMTWLQCYFLYVAFTYTYGSSEGFDATRYYGTPRSASLTNIQEQTPATPSTPGTLGLWMGSLPHLDLATPGPCMPGCAPAPASLCDGDDPNACTPFDTHEESGIGALYGRPKMSPPWYCQSPMALTTGGLSATQCTTGQDCTGCALVPLGQMKVPY